MSHTKSRGLFTAAYWMGSAALLVEWLKMEPDKRPKLPGGCFIRLKQFFERVGQDNDTYIAVLCCRSVMSEVMDSLGQDTKRLKETANQHLVCLTELQEIRLDASDPQGVPELIQFLTELRRLGEEEEPV